MRRHPLAYLHVPLVCLLTCCQTPAPSPGPEPNVQPSLHGAVASSRCDHDPSPWSVLASHQHDDHEALHLTLSNGLTVILVHQPSAREAVAQLWFRVGSRHEPELPHGVAHMVEHALFLQRVEGTPIIDHLLSQGARVDGETGREKSVVTTVIAPEHVRELMALEASRFKPLDVSTERFEEERAVVLAEFEERVENNPRGRLDVALTQAAYATSPWRHHPVGERVHLQRMSLAQIQHFHRSHYSPANAAWILTGRWSPDDVFDELCKTLVPLTARPSPPGLAATPAAKAHAVEVRAPVEVDVFKRVYRLGALSPDEDASMLVLEQLLGAPYTGRWVQRLSWGETPLAAEVWVSLVRLPVDTLLEVDVTLRRGADGDAVAAALDEVLAQLSDQPLAPEERLSENRLRMLMHRQTLTEPLALAQELGEHWLMRAAPLAWFNNAWPWEGAADRGLQDALDHLLHRAPVVDARLMRSL